MVFFRLLAGGLWLGLPLASFAQGNPTVPTSKLYVGLAAYSGPYQHLGSANTSTSGTNTTVPVQATVGYQLRPRLAVQLGLTYSGYKYARAYTYDFIDTNTNQIHYDGDNSTTVRTLTTAVLLRYALTRKPTHRFQADVVGGLLVIHQRVHTIGTDAYSYANPSQGTPVINEYDKQYRYTSLNIDLGPGFRYRFGQRLEAVGDILFNLPLTGNYRHLDSSLALGLRYHFGQ